MRLSADMEVSSGCPQFFENKGDGTGLALLRGVIRILQTAGCIVMDWSGGFSEKMKAEYPSVYWNFM